MITGLVEENLNNFETTTTSTTNTPLERKRLFDDMEDCDVQDVLSQFYMPPTPRMLTCIDDDEDVNVVDDEPPPKRVRMDTSEVKSETMTNNGIKSDFRIVTHGGFVSNITEESSRLQRYHQDSETSNSSSYSCGHASMFQELQTNVFHSLIASLET